MDIEIEVDGERLERLADELDGIYNRLRRVKGDLEEQNRFMNRNWIDEAVNKYNQQYEKGIDNLWDLLVAIDQISGFFRAAADGYAAAEQKIMSL